jgi:hypothetical protein
MKQTPILLALVAAPLTAHADEPPNHAHGGHEMGSSVETTAHEGMEHGDMTGVLGLPMARHGSGTAWLPDDTPVRAAMWMAGDWHLMAHGNLFAGYDAQMGDGRDDKVVSQNWLMVMAGRPIGRGELELRGMYSLEPLTVGDAGYPLLLQTGETYEGEPLVDRQHPHDLIMETAATYRHAITDGVAVEGYAALAGEPAVGPVAFPHRFSSMADPLAPISHHWQDSTHISYGVFTAGVFTRAAKLEASWFNGREPDENRWDLDLRAPDSYATRLSINAGAHWSLQGSYAWLDSPEALESDESVQRWTASATHSMTDGARAWMTTAAWGRNVPEHGRATDSALVETALDLDPIGVTFARAEYVVKTGHDFALPDAMAEERFPVGALSLGHVHPLPAVGGVEPGVGIRGSLDFVDDDLAMRYGTNTPYGVMVFVQVQPDKLAMH